MGQNNGQRQYDKRNEDQVGREQWAGKLQVQLDEEENKTEEDDEKARLKKE